MIYEQMSVEQQVALAMGDADAWDWEDYSDEGCSRAAISEADRGHQIETEPVTLKFNPHFDTHH